MADDRFGREDEDSDDRERPSLFKDPAQAGSSARDRSGPSLDKDPQQSGGWAPPQPGRGDAPAPPSGGWGPPSGSQAPAPGSYGAPPQQQPWGQPPQQPGGYQPYPQQHPYQQQQPYQQPPYQQQPYQQQPYQQQPYQSGPVLQLASYGDRAAASLVDALVRLGISALLIGLGALLFLVSEDAGGAGIAIGFLLTFIIPPLYTPIMMGRTNGQTLGHRTTNTRVVNANLAPMTGGKAFVREILVKYLLFEIGGLFFLCIPTLLNYLWPAWDGGNEALHDKICSTRVVRE